jgi:hypothetical protein
MTIRCPHCGRDGRLPSGLASQRQFLRCRKCQGRFTTLAHNPTSQGTDDGDSFGSISTARIEGELARFPLEPSFLASFDDDELDDDDLPSTLTDPADSNYEITAALEDELDDSQFELPAVIVGDRSTAESPIAAAFDPTGAESPPAEPQYYVLIDRWTRIVLFGTLSMGVPTLLVVAVLLLKAVLDGPIAGAPTSTLVLLFAATLAFVLFTSATSALNVLLIDLARNTRQLRTQAARKVVVETE